MLKSFVSINLTQMLQSIFSLKLTQMLRSTGSEHVSKRQMSKNTFIQKSDNPNFAVSCLIMTNQVKDTTGFVDGKFGWLGRNRLVRPHRGRLSLRFEILVGAYILAGTNFLNIRSFEHLLFQTFTILDICSFLHTLFWTLALLDTCFFGHMLFRTHTLSDTCSLRHMLFQTNALLDIYSFEHSLFFTHNLSDTRSSFWTLGPDLICLLFN